MEEKMETNEQAKEEQAPIEFKAVFYPDGRLNVNCSLMNNPLVMRGFMDMIHDAVKKILDTPPEPNRILRPQGKSFLDGIRRMK